MWRMQLESFSLFVSFFFPWSVDLSLSFLLLFEAFDHYWSVHCLLCFSVCCPSLKSFDFFVKHLELCSFLTVFSLSEGSLEFVVLTLATNLWQLMPILCYIHLLSLMVHLDELNNETDTYSNYFCNEAFLVNTWL